MGIPRGEGVIGVWVPAENVLEIETAHVESGVLGIRERPHPVQAAGIAAESSSDIPNSDVHSPRRRG